MDTIDETGESTATSTEEEVNQLTLQLQQELTLEDKSNRHPSLLQTNDKGRGREAQ